MRSERVGAGVLAAVPLGVYGVLLISGSSPGWVEPGSSTHPSGPAETVAPETVSNAVPSTALPELGSEERG